MTTLIHPPITGDPQLDSWTYQLTSLINQGLNAGEISASQSSVDSGSTALFLYQRSTSNSTAPTLPTSVVYNFENSPIVSSANNGWTSTIPTTGGDNVWVTLRYVATRSGTITGSNSWNTAALLGTGGADGADGVDGNDGKSVAALSIYKRSSSAISQAPTGGSYNFNSNTISPPTGWSASIPSGTGTVYISLSTATSAAGGTGTDSSLTWGVPDLYLQDGAAGAAGTDARSTYQALIFIRASSAPSTPSGGSFNFGTNTLTTPSGWSASVPSGTNPIYASRGLFSVSGDTGTDSTVSWSAPELFVQNGTNGTNGTNGNNGTDGTDGTDGNDGADGLSTYFFPIYKRSSSTISSAPTGGSYNFGNNTGTAPTGWSTTVPSGTNPLYISTTVASVQGTTATDSSLTWSTPVILSQNGADGVDGAAGSNGSSVAFVSIYQRASSAPSAPSSGGSYNFTNNTLTAPNNWYTSVPSGNNPVYMSVSTAVSAAGGGGTDSTLTWGTPTLLAQNGTNGADGADGADGNDGGTGAAGSDGVSTYQAIVFQRASSAPNAPTNGSFNFGNNTLTNPTGWSDTVPSGNNPIYATRNLFSVSGDTGTDTSVNWSTPTLFVENGTNGTNGTNGNDGADGLSTFLFPIYIRASSAPSTPTGGAYNFGTNSGTAPSGWSTSVPSGTNPIYISTSLATVQGATGSDTSLTWSSPQILAQNGTNGQDGDDGADAPRLAQRIIYTNPAVATAPSAPAATVTWSTGALSGMSSGWSESPPTQSATSSDSVYSSVVVFNDTSGSATTTTATGATPVKATEFSGLVTFSSGDFVTGGSTITNIDGGNITTGSISVNRLSVTGASDGNYLSIASGQSIWRPTGFLHSATSSGSYTLQGGQTQTVKIEIWGAGGGGGGGHTNGTGGGGGGYASFTASLSNLGGTGTSISYTIGSGGTGSNATNTGAGSGGTTTVTVPSVGNATASGGTGGSSAGNQSQRSSAPGGSGSLSTAVSTIATLSLVQSGGSTAGLGSTGYITGGAVANVSHAGGGGSTKARGGTSSAAGTSDNGGNGGSIAQNGNAPGGGGGANGGTWNNSPGGNGAAGRIVITET